MGFRGYWFNNSQQFNTNKHPHCYIGTIKKLSDVIWGALNKITNPNYTTVWGALNKITNPNYNTVWGVLNKITNPNYNTVWGTFNSTTNSNYNTVWGDYGGNEMVRSALGFNNLSDNFAIENLWHKLPGAYTNDQEILYDANGKKMDNPKYVIDIFYKLILPSTYEDNEDTNLVMYTDNDVMSKYRASTLSKLCKDIVGIPCMYDKYNQPHCIITGSSPTNYLELPSSSELGFDSNLPVGTDIVDLSDKSDYIWGYNNHSYFRNTAGKYNSSHYLNLSDGVDVQSTVNTALLTSINYSNGLVHYGINPSQATCGLPFKGNNNQLKALMPSLFTGYIMQTPFLKPYISNSSPDKTLTGALYICLGVSKI